jgi:hypothetical protein
MSVPRYLAYTFLLILVETGICILFFEASLFFVKYKVDSWHIAKAIRDGIEVNLMRVIFYYLFYAVLFYFLLGTKTWKWRLLQIAVFNCGIYICLSLLYSALGAAEYLTAEFFYFLIAATFLSPFVLGKKVQRKLLTRA